MGQKPKNKNRELTQAEIWDDSALIRSWEDAVEEYKLYHSIHARGEKVEDFLRRAESDVSEDAKIGPEKFLANQDHSNDQAEAVAEDYEQGEVDDEATTELRHENEVSIGPQRPAASASSLTQPLPEPSGSFDAGGQAQGLSPMPLNVIGEVKDEGLKNLMMAWYYAGYYTGLHEGQQRASRQPKTDPHQGVS